jgi:hypothetical protein
MADEAKLAELADLNEAWWELFMPRWEKGVRGDHLEAAVGGTGWLCVASLDDKEYVDFDSFEEARLLIAMLKAALL